MKGFFRMAERITIYSLANEIGVTATMVSRAFTPNAKMLADKTNVLLWGRDMLSTLLTGSNIKKADIK